MSARSEEDMEAAVEEALQHAPEWERTDDAGVPRIAWDSETHALWVEFSGSGNIYRFDGVARRFFTDMRKASNLRRFVRSQLMGRFQYERVKL